MKPRDFSFDSVFGAEATQTDVFAPLRGMVEGTLAGYNASILAYGPSGAGKTHSIMGNYMEESSLNDPSAWGILQRSLAALFAAAEARAGWSTILKLTFVELHCSKFRDLLAQPDASGSLPAVNLRDAPSRGVFLTGSETLGLQVHSLSEALAAVQTGLAHRKVGITDLNEHSSRSHAIMIVDVVGTRAAVDGEGTVTRKAKLFIGDLAGSERLASGGGHDPKLLAETQSINLSLTALTDVLSALSSKSQDGWLVPYRNSKLTHILRDALGGGSRTVLLAHVHSEPTQFRSTLLSLQYACRAKQMDGMPVAQLAFGENGGAVPARKLEEARCQLDATNMELSSARELHASSQQQVSTLRAELAAAREAASAREAQLQTQMQEATAAAAAARGMDESLMVPLSALPPSSPLVMEAGVMTSPIATPHSPVVVTGPVDDEGDLQLTSHPSTPQLATASLQTSPSLLESLVATQVHPRVAAALLAEKSTLEAQLADKYDEVTAVRVQAAEAAARNTEQAHWAEYAKDLRQQLTEAEGATAEAVDEGVAAARSQWEDVELPAAVTAAADAAAAAADSEVMQEYKAKLGLWKSKAKEAVAAAKSKIAAARAQAKAGQGAAEAAAAEVQRLQQELAKATDPLAAPTPSKKVTAAKGKEAMQLRAAVTRLRAERARRKELECALAEAEALAASHASAVAAREEEVAAITGEVTAQMAAAIDERDRAVVLAQHDAAVARCEVTQWRLKAHRMHTQAIGAVGQSFVQADAIEQLQAQLQEAHASKDALANFAVALVRDLQDALHELEDSKATAAAAQSAAAQAESKRLAAERTAADSAAARHTAAAVAAAERDAQWKGVSETLKAMQGAGMAVGATAGRVSAHSRGSHFSSLPPMSDSDGIGFAYTHESSDEEAAPPATQRRRAQDRRERSKKQGKPRAVSREQKAAAAAKGRRRASGGATSDSSFQPGAASEGAASPMSDINAFSGESPEALAVMSRIARRSLAWAAEGRRSLDGGASLPVAVAEHPCASSDSSETKASPSTSAASTASPVAKPHAKRSTAAKKPKPKAAKPKASTKAAPTAEAEPLQTVEESVYHPAQDSPVTKSAAATKPRAASKSKPARSSSAPKRGKGGKTPISQEADQAPASAKASRKAGKRPRALAAADENARYPSPGHKGAATQAPVATTARDEFDVPSTESGALFSAEELNALSGAGAAGGSKKRRLLGKGQGAALTKEPVRAAASGFKMGMGAFGRSGGFAIPQLKGRTAAR